MARASAITEESCAGLSGAEVARRHAEGRDNRVVDRTSRSLWSIVRANVLTLFNAILVAAIVLVLLFGHPQDVVFGGVMVINAIIGVVAEWRAKRALDALALVDAPTVRAIRDGQECTIPFEEIVLGDVLVVGLGDQVPVDCEVLSSAGLEVDESMLTGESVPVRKGPGDEARGGTAVVAGSGVLVARAVGEDVWARGVAREAKRFTRTVSEIQTSTDRVLRWIAIMLLPMTALLAWSQLQVSPDEHAWRRAVVLAVAGVVGMVPQGLVLLTSMNFAIGAATLARREVLVQELPAVEVLARVDSLCLDKTGTLTTGGIHLRELIALEGADEERVRSVLAALSADRANPTAVAIHGGIAAEAVAAPGAGAGEWNVPFSSARKWSARGDARTSWFLGAPEMLLDPGRDARALALTTEHASQGRRVVALVEAAGLDAAGTVPEADELEVLRRSGRAAALVVLEEELRSSAAPTLEWFAAQGVRVRVISGDNPATVAALAERVGLTAPDGSAPVAVDARTLPEDVGSAEFVRAVEEGDVFGRVTPEQKRAMVRALRAEGHCVAMTGDGVNDALALKDADLGIAMGNGAAATKAVARLVLVGGDFSVLPGVVAEGRRIIANMERVSALFLTKTVYSVVVALVCAVGLWSYPYLPRHFTYIDVFTIGVPAFFIALGPNTRRWVPGFLHRTLALAVPSGVILAVTMLVAYRMAGIGSPQGHTVATLTLMAGAMWVLSITARPLVAWRVGLIGLMTAGALGGVFIPVVRHFFALEWPTAQSWPWIVGMGALACVLVEVAHRAHHGRAHARAEAVGAAR